VKETLKDGIPRLPSFTFIQKSTQERTMSSPQKTRVLYLEDDKDSREMVTFLLSSSSMEIATATTSEEAARLAENDPFDLYLLEGFLPAGDSFGLCRELRRNAPSTPIIYYSRLGFPTDIKKGLDAGADAYLVKPYAGDLKEAVTDIVLNAKMIKCGLILGVTCSVPSRVEQNGTRWRAPNGAAVSNNKREATDSLRRRVCGLYPVATRSRGVAPG
jgi:DNA-binding response OmpR family regulator